MDEYLFIPIFFFLYFFKKCLVFFFYNYFTGLRVNDVAGWGSSYGVRIGEVGGDTTLKLKKLLSSTGECYSWHWRRRPKCGFHQPTPNLFIFTRFSFFFFFFFFFWFCCGLENKKKKRRGQKASRRKKERN
jgi:hypothetical protein